MSLVATLNFDIAAVRRSFSDALIASGTYISRLRGVEALAPSGNGSGVSFLVRDPSDGHTYSGVLNPQGHPETLSLVTSCSCRLHQCRHACAAALAAVFGNAPWSSKALVHLERSQDNALNEWLESALPTPRAPGEEPAASTLCYIVKLKPGHSPVVEVEPKNVAILKGGKLGKQRDVRINMQGWHEEKESSALYLLGLSGLSEVVSDEWRNHVSTRRMRFKPDLAAAALEAIVISGNAYLDRRDREPLHLQRIERDELRWVDVGEGLQHPRPATRPQAVIVPTKPAWYVDRETNTAGPIDLGLEPETVARLVTIPPLSEKQAERAHRVWHRYFPSADVPPPKTELAIRYERAAMVPHIRLTRRRSRFGGDGIAAEVSFAYGPNVAKLSDVADDFQRTDDRTVVIVPRDRAQEAAALTTLEATGLQPSYRAYMGGDRDAYCFPESDPMAEWLHFLRTDVPRLEDQGWVVQLDESFPYSVTEIDDWDLEIEPTVNQWFDLDLGVDVDGQRVSILPHVLELIRNARIRTTEELADHLDAGNGLVVSFGKTGQYLAIPKERILRMFATIVELFDDPPISADGRLRLSRAQLSSVSLNGETGITWRGSEALKPLLEFLRNPEAAERIELPSSFKGELRPYQQVGVQWLQLLLRCGFGAILADDMGLGKTVQVAAHMAIEKEAKRLHKPSLVIAKASGLPHWVTELHRFTPSLRVHEFTGTDRHDQLHALDETDVVLTTHALFSRSAEALAEREWAFAVVDEAQAMKNPNSVLAQAVQSLNVVQPIALTGTPVENTLDDLHSIMSFAVPGLLGDRKRFARLYRTPIEKRDDAERRTALSRRVAPFVMRRTKKEVAKELPPKTEILTEVVLSGAQRDLYETLRIAMLDRVRQELRDKGLARSHIVVLDALLKLRQVCCDPRLVKLPTAREVKHSQKLSVLFDMLPELIADGRRILLFSQFTEMLDLMIPELRTHEIPFVEIRGSTRDRTTPKERFDRGEVPVFLLSLKAGGTSLNLQSADTVIHYDPWWNPAVEAQATDRAYRIGQTQPVFVYKLITTGTVEERIVAMQERKGRLAEQLFTAGGTLSNLNESDIEALFAPLH